MRPTLEPSQLSHPSRHRERPSFTGGSIDELPRSFQNVLAYVQGAYFHCTIATYDRNNLSIDTAAPPPNDDPGETPLLVTMNGGDFEGHGAHRSGAILGHQSWGRRKGEQH
ncbi:uncharacterized protein EAE97_008905 [Botrytis byssoidea]|uniref:Uncharacterized protein n=1 Tax=Botrytis byssoidea TaxID=139641 RepID=A0A9P5LXT3_9HELO|nr:uncharacterized protein EAE97_008905 [Botrytis byssoidea]KAF7933138.1 hypothetical protein EAE97_008905 [Botrytis byssoidea]